MTDNETNMTVDEAFMTVDEAFKILYCDGHAMEEGEFKDLLQDLWWAGYEQAVENYENQ